VFDEEFVVIVSAIQTSPLIEELTVETGDVETGDVDAGTHGEDR